MNQEPCVIPYCDFSTQSHTGDDCKLVPICKSHLIHIGCLKQLLTKDKAPKCPICRDDYLSQLKDLITENPTEKREMEPWEELSIDTPSIMSIVNLISTEHLPNVFNVDFPPSPKRHINRKFNSEKKV